MTENELFVSCVWAVVIMLCVFSIGRNFLSAIECVFRWMYESHEERDERFTYEKEINK